MVFNEEKVIFLLRKSMNDESAMMLRELFIFSVYLSDGWKENPTKVNQKNHPNHWMESGLLRESEQDCLYFIIHRISLSFSTPTSLFICIVVYCAAAAAAVAGSIICRENWCQHSIINNLGSYWFCSGNPGLESQQQAQFIYMLTRNYPLPGRRIFHLCLHTS